MSGKILRTIFPNPWPGGKKSKIDGMEPDGAGERKPTVTRCLVGAQDRRGGGSLLEG